MKCIERVSEPLLSILDVMEAQLGRKLITDGELLRIGRPRCRFAFIFIHRYSNLLMFMPSHKHHFVFSHSFTRPFLEYL